MTYSIILLVWKKTQIIQFANKKIFDKLVSGKKFHRKKKRLKAYVPLGKNQPITQCQTKRKSTNRIP